MSAVDEAGYAGYPKRLRTIYATLEHIGRSNTDDPLVAAVVDPALDAHRRTPRSDVPL